MRKNAIRLAYNHHRGPTGLVGWSVQVTGASLATLTIGEPMKRLVALLIIIWALALVGDSIAKTSGSWWFASPKISYTKDWLERRNM